MTAVFFKLSDYDYYNLQVYDGRVGWYVGTDVSDKPFASTTMIKQQK
jgi:hypothetical protein